MSTAARIPIRWTDEFLDTMRQTTDPLADDAVNELFNTGEVDAVEALMNHLIRDDQLVPERLPENIQNYLKTTASLPDWADTTKIAIAERLFARCGPSICASLMVASLPSAYAAAKGVQVLQMTARLKTDPTRRIGETAQMIIDVLVPGGLGEGGKGVRAAQKVRLMHAAVRNLISRSGRWNADWGQPINQEDLAGTLMTFSRIVLSSLDKLKVRVESEEAEAYLHAWNVVGHIMGIRDELLPDNLAQADELTQIIARRQQQASEAGQEMTRALINMLEAQMPGTVFKGMPDTMIRYLVGDDVANMIGVTKEDWTEHLIGPVGDLFGILEKDHKSTIMSKVAARFSMEFVESVAWLYRGGNRATFRIPDTLREQWGLKRTPIRGLEQKLTGDLTVHPFGKLDSDRRRRLILGLLISTGLLFAAAAASTNSLINDAAPWGLLSFELGGSVEATIAVVNSWHDGHRIRAGFALGFDFLFMVSLTNLLALASVQAASRLRTPNSALAKMGSVLAWGQWLAGVLWISQNLLLVTMLTGPVTSPRPEIVYWCGAIKFSLLGLALVYVLFMRLRGNAKVSS
ncbi:MAG TPA: oxygenase MpaB family protein [Blastocatellia bacterium]|nr:oxygenase MpaB family protein [Blastocatellia bacterium]